MKNNSGRGGRSGGQSRGGRGRGGGEKGSASNRQTAEIAGLPVAKNDDVTIDIVGMNHDGEGVGRADGYTLFVAGALPGERISARVLKTKKQYGYAKMQTLLEASPARVEPPCEIFDRCGGCQIQHMDYAAQLEWKRRQVADSLERIGKLNVRPFGAESAVGEGAGEALRTGGAIGADGTKASAATAEAGAQAAGPGEAGRDSGGADSEGETAAQTVVTPEEAATAFGGGEGYENSGTAQGGGAVSEAFLPDSEAGPASEAAAPDFGGSATVGGSEAAHAPGAAGILVPPTLGMSEPWRYRNKAQVPMGQDNGRLIGGFYARGSHRIVDMETCIIQHEANDEMVETVKQIGRELGISAYDEETGRGLLRHVVVKVAFATGEKMVVLVTNGDRLPRVDDWVEEIWSRIPDVKSICQNVNTRQTNVIFGDVTRVLWGEEVIHDYIGDVKFAISARSFYQVNPAQTEVLYGKTLEYAGLTGSETVIDAYCGIGTISLFLAQKAKRVYGVEIVKEAIEDARKNAVLNGIENAEFEVGASEDVIPRWKEQGITPDVIVVDPPRKGCDIRLLETILEMKPERVVYVSCNPATLARDLRVLEDGGFKTVKVQPVDMFPQTVHVEAVALLVRRK
ncbi:23S rRNA (uracil(1939)-C(5))-methyltransferase RlmD [Saccharibacillus sp. CPCC 101409]|uniref:23S rRNA (uracil(1939)-C(5))-methyltransferase RlmD n=1 Tax=Saccharibacillus sp. CPCC 101409 TaxID=3058041 RepID=UPI0026739336|nr:23S rRNA (uracil(1939)-C(5))-methyltransferase RlmD [Saccharibacillus sp. CPCC 101409]MDO3412577.1 23S rRNA (uracil(1939)-C(5))-methyltransferase RlmD [Saccharibacillus sp. CPCC 101409]